MGIKIFGFIGMVSMILWSCGNRIDRKSDKISDNLILQQEDGSLLLELEKAVCYNDVVDPSGNTAEWSVAISKAGRYEVWLSSATKDTVDLNYTSKVKMYFQDSRMEVNPEYSKIIQNSEDVSYPYYRADSYMGSFFISEPGEYIIQLISEKIISLDEGKRTTSVSDSIRLLSLILTPFTR